MSSLQWYEEEFTQLCCYIYWILIYIVSSCTGINTSLYESRGLLTLLHKLNKILNNLLTAYDIDKRFCKENVTLALVI